jgi:hypothetical protein
VNIIHTISIFVLCIKIGELRNITESVDDNMITLYYLINYNLALILYGCETRSLTLRGHILKVFEKWVLRKMFGTKRGEIMETLRKLHNE